MAAPTPLSRYVKVQRATDREMARILKDAADEAEKIMLRLAAKKGAGAAIRRAQLGGTLRALRKLQADMWGSVSKATEMGMRRAGEAAADAEAVLNKVLFDAAGVNFYDFETAMHVQAQEAVANVVARGINDIPLSSQVYKTRALSQKQVSRAIDRALLLNFSAKELAATVKSLINPNVRGGVSYAANRLARTEINNAFHRSQISLRENDPWTTGMKWELSGSHPRPDECNEYADRSHFRGGDPGVFKPGNVPDKPHPNCLCYLTTETIGVEDFINKMASGDFDSYMGKYLDDYGA